MNFFALMARASKDAANDFSHYKSSAAELSAQLKTGAGRFYGGAVEIVSVVQYWLHLFDATAIPTNGTVPLYRRKLTPQAINDLPLGLMFAGLLCQNGIWVGLSTTRDTLTISAANDADFDLFFK